MQFASYLKPKKKQNGQGFVEFALILPILLLLVLGIIEVGRLLFIYVAVTSSSREAARFGAAVGELPNGLTRYEDCTAIRGAASGIGSLAGVEADDIIIQYDSGLANLVATPLPYAECPVNGVGPGDVDLGDRITVRVQTDYAPILGIVPLPSFPISSVSSRTILESVPIGTASILPTITFTPTPVRPTMWVYDVSIIVTQPGANKFQAEATVTIRGGSPDIEVPNATVTGLFAGDASNSDSKNTNGSGQAVLVSDSINGAWNSFTLCVNVATAPTHYYDASENLVTCASISNVTPSATPITPSPTPITPSPTPVTPSATPITPSPTASFTASPTITPTATATPSHTPTFTPGPSPTPSDTPTATFTPSPTNTLPPTATSTPTKTETPSPTPTPICNYYTGNFTFTESFLFWGIENNTGGPRTITSINISWPGSGEGQILTEIKFAGTTIWLGNSNSGNTDIDVGWEGNPVDRLLVDGGAKTLQFTFASNLKDGIYSLVVGFDDNCLLEHDQYIVP